jgi:hypothetical protein
MNLPKAKITTETSNDPLIPIHKGWLQDLHGISTVAFQYLIQLLFRILQEWLH